MKTRTRLPSGSQTPVAAIKTLSYASRWRTSDRIGWTSQALLTHTAGTAAVWAAGPAVLGIAVEGLAAGRPGFAVFAVLMHQMGVLFLSRHVDRQSTWGTVEWSILAVGGALTATIAHLTIALWLLLPVGPALLLWKARREHVSIRLTAPMRIFSMATFGAILVQLASAMPSTGIAIAALGGTCIYLAGLERLVTDERPR